MKPLQQRGARAFFIRFAVVLGATASLDGIAADCRFRGVEFRGLNTDQVKALASAGGECRAASAEAAAASPRLGDKGFVLLEGRKSEYVDLAAENAAEIAGEPVEIYGHYSYFSEINPAEAWSVLHERFRGTPVGSVESGCGIVPATMTSEGSRPCPPMS